LPSAEPRYEDLLSTGNSLLDSLPSAEFAAVEAALRLVEVPRGAVLLDYGSELESVDFPTSLVVSLLAQTSNGDPIEVSMVGAEGALGAWVTSGVAWSPWLAVSQVAGEVWRWPASDATRDLPGLPVLQDRLQKYALSQSFLMSQSVLCNRFHELPQRTARWLLIMRTKSHVDPLPITQEILSQMLGVHRPSVTLALQTLSEAGLIRSEGRGLIRLLDLEGLESLACECFERVQEFNRAVSGNSDTGLGLS